MPRMHREKHHVSRIGWLRAAVLGANDGILSTASLVIGVAASGSSRSTILIAGAAGLVAGAMSMAAGEYVSVRSQSDAEEADLARERAELATDAHAELRELTAIYIKRGLDSELAEKVAVQLTAKDALAAHARDELGITSVSAPRPVQAAFASAASFTAGAALPLTAAAFVPMAFFGTGVAAGSLVFLAGLGALAAHAGGAPMFVSAARVTFWGALAMAVTAGVGTMFGTVVG